MSKKLSYKGKLPIGEQERIKLSTIDGKTGYRIIDFRIIPGRPGVDSGEYIGQIFKRDQTGSITSVIDFTNSDLVAMSMFKTHANNVYANSESVIFDNEKFNQDIYIYISDVGGRTEPANYYIELESMELSELETTMLTLKNLRTIASQ